MKRFNYIIYILIFLLVGEIIVRIDQHFDPLNNNPLGVEVKLKESPLKQKIDNQSFIPSENEIRVMVLGDSYINGARLDSASIFSSVLNEKLNTNFKNKYNIKILDVSRPSNNSEDNYLTFNHYYNKFNPNFIIWAYHFNDVLGGVDVNTEQSDTLSLSVLNSPPKRTTKKLSTASKFRKKLYSISKLSSYLIQNLQKELKQIGITLPVGDFYSLTKKLYKETSVNWKESQIMFDEVSSKCKDNNIDLIVFKMPEFNLLKNPKLFETIDGSLQGYMNTNESIIYLDGMKYFKEEDGTKYQISKYDGHPNEKAHLKIAEIITETIHNNVNFE
ncbi:MAG: hypothetical protein HKO56_02455 [Bacteroidia bacterium]|nr:hypothetical protein [Bacteroidia bacterium]NNM15493.1 hypothetical protein [Bacteroidia bacterium]